METLYVFLALVLASCLALFGWRILNRFWLKPMKLEKRLKMSGLRGTPYRLLFGDVKEMARLKREAMSKPMSLNHDIVPRVSPFIGETLAEYGGNCYMWLGPTPTLLVTESELIKEIFNQNDIFLKPLNPLVKLLGNGLFSHEKEKWAKHRKLINPALQLERVKLMVSAFHSSCCDMLSKWEKISPVEESFQLDVWPYLQTLTSDAISRTAFGSNYEEGQKIFELQKELVEHALKVMQFMYIPGWRFVPTQRNRKVKEIARKLDSSVMEIILNRVKMVKAGKSAQNQDILDVLLESNSKEIEQRGDKKYGMSLDDVLEECKMFYFAGQETTAVLLVWTLILLGIHPEWQDRAREEVQRVVGDESNNPKFDEFNNLKVITMILNEVLRLYAPGNFLRSTVNETRLGNLVLPAGVQIFVPTLALHRDTKIWGEDANEFKPERFSEGVMKATKGQVAFVPFGWGPRICPAQNFSMLESKIALAMMLQNYSFELSPSYTHAPTRLVTVHPQHGAPLILRRL